MITISEMPQRLDRGASPTFNTVFLGDGAPTTPTVTFSSETSLGFSKYSAGNIRFSSFGLNTWVFGRNASLATLYNPTGGGGITANDSGNVAIAASGTNQNITLTPSGTGQVTTPAKIVAGAITNPNGSWMGGVAGGSSSGQAIIGYWTSLTNSVALVSTDAGAGSFSQMAYLATRHIFSITETECARFDASLVFSLSGSTVNYNAPAAGGANSSTRFRKAVTAIANAVATGVLTVTIPNAAHSAQLNVYLTGSLGAGGAIGANEATGVIGYSFAITRTAGVNAVVTASSAFGSATASVAGGATITITAAASAISGAVGATNTFTVNVTISRGTGTSTNHTCQITAELDNANASGITLA
jgi:hypothetical protein